MAFGDSFTMRSDLPSIPATVWLGLVTGILQGGKDVPFVHRGTAHKNPEDLAMRQALAHHPLQWWPFDWPVHLCTPVLNIPSHSATPQYDQNAQLRAGMNQPLAISQWLLLHSQYCLKHWLREMGSTRTFHSFIQVLANTYVRNSKTLPHMLSRLLEFPVLLHHIQYSLLAFVFCQQGKSGFLHAGRVRAWSESSGLPSVCHNVSEITYTTRI